MNKKPIIAFLYDFDKTLCTTDMQDYTFIPSLGYTPGEFWSIANSFGFENRMDGLLAYMYTMIEECRKKGHPPGPRLPRLLRACDRAVPRRAGLVLAHQRLRRNAGRGDRALRALLRPARDHRGQRREPTNLRRSTPANSSTTKRALLRGRSSTSTSQTRPSLSTASTREYSTSQRTRSSTLRCPTTPSASRSRT